MEARRLALQMKSAANRPRPIWRRTTSTRSRVTTAYLALGRLQEALDTANSSLNINLRQYGPDALDTGVAYSTRARVMAALARPDDARNDLDQAERIFKGLGQSGEVLARQLVALRQTLMSNQPSSDR